MSNIVAYLRVLRNWISKTVGLFRALRKLLAGSEELCTKVWHTTSSEELGWRQGDCVYKILA
jgi:hypothetical protein